MALTIGQVCEAVADTMGAATGINRVQHYDALSEGLMDADLPLLQVYFDSFRVSPPGDTDRHTMTRGVIIQRLTLFADVLCCQRHMVWQDVEVATRMASQVLDRLEATYPTRPYFGLDGIKAWSITSAQRSTMAYGQAEYVVVRFTIEVVIY